MGTKRELLNRVVVVKPYRKSGNGGVGGGRLGNSGKKGSIFQIEADGSRTELASATGTTFKALARTLRATGHIPQHVALNKSGETAY